MRYEVRLTPNAAPIVVDVTETGGTLKVTADGAPLTVDAVRIGSQISLLINGRVVESTHYRGKAMVENERMAAQKASGSTRVEKTVKSPMPGRIVKVSVKAGDAVKVGDPLLVVEAMKMENELRAKSDAVVADVFATVGQTVEAGAKLIQFQ